jgi:hypothetical protein
MMEDPRTITTSIDIITIARAIERIGDHAKNVSEQVVFVVEGRDIRHPRQGGGQVTPTILVVEDEPAIQELVVINLKHAGFLVVRAGSAEEAESAIRARCLTWSFLTGCCPANPASRWPRKSVPTSGRANCRSSC